MNAIRLQLVLAKAGVASRRAAETLITSGRVAVNGKVSRELGVRVDPIADRITVDGREVRREQPAYFILNKPKGYVTTASDPEGRPTVFDLVQQGGVRLFAVGRLDFNTEGALLLTNDGELAHALMHPSRGIEKVYHGKFRYHLSPEQLDRMRRGMVLPPARPLDAGGRPQAASYPRPRDEKPEKSAPCEIAVIKETGQHTWVEVVLHEGKNRQIHRMAEAIGSSLLKLLRVSYAGLEVRDLELGESRALTQKEIATLRRSVGLEPQLEASDEPAAAHAPTSAPSGRPRAARGNGGPTAQKPLPKPGVKTPEKYVSETMKNRSFPVAERRPSKGSPTQRGVRNSGRDLRLRSDPDPRSPAR